MEFVDSGWICTCHEWGKEVVLCQLDGWFVRTWQKDVGDIYRDKIKIVQDRRLTVHKQLKEQDTHQVQVLKWWILGFPFCAERWRSKERELPTAIIKSYNKGAVQTWTARKHLRNAEKGATIHSAIKWWFHLTVFDKILVWILQTMTLLKQNKQDLFVDLMMTMKLSPLPRRTMIGPFEFKEPCGLPDNTSLITKRAPPNRDGERRSHAD